MSFDPQKIPTIDFPFPPGTALLGSMGSLYTVIDRNGHAFLACCPSCEKRETASGWYPQHENGRILARDLVDAGPVWQSACRACVRTPQDIYPCVLPAGHDGDCAPAMAPGETR